jgi:phosphoglycerate dehydrogenase-like enzyme
VRKTCVLYTDPPWLIAGDRADPGLATVEREILGPRVDLRFGPFSDGRYGLDESGLTRLAAGCDVLVIYRQVVTPTLLDAAGGRLRAVIRQGVGVDNLATALLDERGVPAYHLPDYCVDEVATHTAALTLALERGLVAQHAGLSAGLFDIYAGGVPRRISRRTLGIVGFGRIGRAVARRLGTFYGRVVVHDPYLGRDLPEGYGAQAVESLGELLGCADVVTLHCPLTDATRGLVGGAELRRMRAGAYLVNAARGALVDPVALGAALWEGHLGGAALDVFSPENPHDDPRWKAVLSHPSVVVTSHRAFLSAEAELSSRRRVAELARDLLAGDRPVVGRLWPGAAR